MTDPADPKVISLATRKPFEPKSAPPAPKADEPLINPHLVEDLQRLLRMAQAGEIASLSYVTLNRLSGGFDTNAIMAIDSDELPDQHALRHVGALALLKEQLLDIAMGFDEDDLGDDNLEDA